MKKLESLDDLVKAAGHLAGHFGKAADHHQKYSEAHAALAQEHTGMSAFHKGHADALADDHADKAMHKRHSEHHATKAAHHDGLAKLHKAHADHLGSLAEAYGQDKAAAPSTHKAAGSDAAPATTGNVVDLLLKGMAGDLETTTKDMIQNDPAVKDMIRKSIAEALGNALGSKIRPDGVTAAYPSAPPDDVLAHLNLVPRAGQPRLEKATVDAANEEMFAI